MIKQLSILTFTYLVIFPAVGYSASADDWHLPHEQGSPREVPDAKKRLELKGDIIKDIISKKGSGVLSDRFIIDSIHFNFDATAADKKLLKKVGFADDVIEDIVAKGRFQRPKGKKTAKLPIKSYDGANWPVIKSYSDGFIKVNFWRWTDINGHYRLSFINQTDHKVNLHYLQFTEKTRNVNFTSDLRNDDTSPGTNALTSIKPHKRRGRFGQYLLDHYYTQLYPHPENVDKSRHDIWKQDFRFTGNSTAFTGTLGGKNNKQASILQTGPFEYTHNVATDDWGERVPDPVTVDIFYCYSYRDNNGKLFDRCATFNASHGASEKKTENYEYGLTSSIKVEGEEFALGALPFQTKKRDLDKQGLGSGTYNTKTNKIKYMKDKQGKPFIQLYFLDDNKSRSPREKFYVRIELYPDDIKDLKGKYDLTKDSKHWFVAGILISTFHFSNKQVGRQRLNVMDLSKGVVKIKHEDEKGVYGSVLLEGDYNMKIDPKYNDKDKCIEGKEDKPECNYLYSFSVKGNFGAEKR